MAEESLQNGLGQAMHLRRVELHLKRADVAERSNLSYPYVSEIENGVKQPSVAALGRIAQALELSVSELAELSEKYATEPGDRVAWAPPAMADSTLAPAFSTSTRRSSSQLLRQDTGFTTPGPGGPIDIEETVRRVVREELERWEQDRLPELITREMRRRLDQAMGGED